MRESITTKYHGPSNVKGARVSATSSSGSGMRVYLAWDHAADTNTNHKLAAARLAEKMNWHGTWAVGYAPGGRGYMPGSRVFVYLDGDQISIPPQMSA